MSEEPVTSLKSAVFSAMAEKGVRIIRTAREEPCNTDIVIDECNMAPARQCLFTAAAAHGWRLHKTETLCTPQHGRAYHFHSIGADETDIRLHRFCCVSSGAGNEGFFGRLLTGLRAAWQRPGLILAIEGTDGSGKTTIIDGMRRVLETSYPGESIVYYHWRPMFIASEIKKDAAPVTVCAEPHKKRPHGRVKSLLKLAVCTLDYLFGYWCKVRWQAASGKIVVFDRYYYDFYLDQIRYRLQVSHRWLRFFQFFVPEPDISFALTGNAEAIWQRKKEMPPEEVQNQIDTLNRHKALFAHVVTVDVVRPIPEVVGRVSAEVLQALAMHYPDFGK